MGLTPYEPPHDTCPEVSNFRVSVFDGLVQLMWDGVADHEEWQLAWGLASSQPETFQVIDIHTTYRTLTNLDSNVLYAARVRGKCNNGSGYSEWSDTVQFMLEGYQGIESPVDQNTLIMANPAHGDVSVVSSFQIISIEIYGMDGRKLTEQQCSGSETRIDLSSIPKGTYIVRIHTAKGNTAKKLTVE